MSDQHGPRDVPGHGEALPSVEKVARLDAYLDGLGAERRPAPEELSAQELQERQLAAQLRLAQEGVEAPRPEFLQALERQVAGAVAQQGRERRRGLSRGGFLRAAATLAGGAGLGVAGVEGLAVIDETSRPHDLVAQGNERWYAVALDGEVPPGGVKLFRAGGVMGFLLNTEGRLHAVSAVCTHMGCLLKPDGPVHAPTALKCLCHDSRFNLRGEVVRGLAPTALPEIEVMVANGHVLAKGTRESV